MKAAGEQFKFSVSPDDLKALARECNMQPESIIVNQEITKMLLTHADGTEFFCPWGKNIVGLAHLVIPAAAK